VDVNGIVDPRLKKWDTHGQLVIDKRHVCHQHCIKDRVDAATIVMTA